MFYPDNYLNGISMVSDYTSKSWDWHRSRGLESKGEEPAGRLNLGLATVTPSTCKCFERHDFIRLMKWVSSTLEPQTEKNWKKNTFYSSHVNNGLQPKKRRAAHLWF